MYSNVLTNLSKSVLQILSFLLSEQISVFTKMSHVILWVSTTHSLSWHKTYLNPHYNHRTQRFSCKKPCHLHFLFPHALNFKSPLNAKKMRSLNIWSNWTIYFHVFLNYKNLCNTSWWMWKISLYFCHVDYFCWRNM